MLTGKQEYHRYKQEVITTCHLLPLQQLKENNFKVYMTNSHLLEELKFFPVFNLDAQHNVN